jgi:hypothetical protein
MGMLHLKIVTLLTKVVIGLQVSRSLSEKAVSFGKLKKIYIFVRSDSTPIPQCRISLKSVQLGTELFHTVGRRDGQLR